MEIGGRIGGEDDESDENVGRDEIVGRAPSAVAGRDTIVLGDAIEFCRVGTLESSVLMLLHLLKTDKRFMLFRILEYDLS